MRTLLLSVLVVLFPGHPVNPQQPERDELLVRFVHMTSNILADGPGVRTGRGSELVPFLTEEPTVEIDGAASAVDFLASKGVTFPPGAKAVYLRQQGLLYVKNTRENLRLFARILEVEGDVDSIPSIRAEARIVEYDPRAQRLLGAGLTFADVSHNLGQAIKTVNVTSIVTKNGNRAFGEELRPRANFSKLPDARDNPQAYFEMEPRLDPLGKSVDINYSFNCDAPGQPGKPLAQFAAKGDRTVANGGFVVAETFTRPGNAQGAEEKHYALYLSVEVVDKAGRPLPPAKDARESK